MEGNAYINPQYSGSSVRSSNPNPESTEGYTLTPIELVETALGKKFTLGSGKEVNTTYDDWTTNLYVLMKNGHISHQMKEGLIALNKYNRKQGTEVDDSTNETANNSQYEKPPCYYPPFMI